jgi:hypothetical protein
LAELMNVFAEDIDFLEKHNVFLHDARVLLLVHILVLLEHLAKIVHIVFKILALICILAMKVGVALLILHLFLHILLVKTNDALLELLEVGNVMKTLEYVILELLFEAFLIIKGFSEVSDLVSKTFLPHSKIIND